LKDDGILALHISNRYLDLYPVVETAAGHLGKDLVVIRNPEQNEMSIEAATWVLMTSNQLFLKQEEVSARVVDNLASREIDLWTDDYSNLLGVLK